VTDDGAHDRPLVARTETHGAAGIVRLDNRVDALRWLGMKDSGRRITDLEIVLRTIAEHGTKYVPQLIGDFAVIVWDARTGRAIAMSDALAVKRLYYSDHDGALAFASRAEALARGDDYNRRYLAEMVATCPTSSGETVYTNVYELGAGTLAVYDGRRRTTTQTYWSPDAFQTQRYKPSLEREAPAQLRDLLTESLRQRLDHGRPTWSQLSGGLDSSSIVSLVQWLAERGQISNGLAGTVTFVDRQNSTADEREYSNAVVSRWQVRNETIVDPPLWLDEDGVLPRFDQPRYSLAVYPRERRVCDIIKRAQGQVLLCGYGSDELFTGNMLFFADWLARGRVWPAVKEMAHRAALGRASFWKLAYNDAVRPLLPSMLRDRLAGRPQSLAPWISRDAVRNYGLDGRAGSGSAYAGRLGHKYHDAIATSIRGFGAALEGGPIGDELDVRFPFLYRPLVEFGLQLPPELCARPYERKWALREAMRDILPDVVRTRIGKGASNDLLGWSLTAQRTLLEPLLHNPILADLGVIDASALRTAFEIAPRRTEREGELHTYVQTTLMVEAWLEMRSGRWPSGGQRHEELRTDIMMANVHT